MAKHELSPSEQRTAHREREDARRVSRLRTTTTGRTAAELYTLAVRLRSIEGVIEVGRVRTGKAGRPAVIFGLEGVHEVQESLNGDAGRPDNEDGDQVPHGTDNDGDGDADDSDQGARDGSLNQQVVS